MHEVGFSPMELLFTPMIPFRNVGSFTLVVENNLAASTTTQMYGQLETAGYPAKGDAVGVITDSVLNAVSRASGRSFTYVYWTEVDSCAHTYGVSHPITRTAVIRAAALAESLGNALKGEARFVVTADHGHLDSPDDCWIQLNPSSSLSRYLTCVPAGEPRTVFFHTKPGRDRDFEQHFNDSLGERFILMRSESAIELGLFGPAELVSDGCRARVGDFFALSRGRWSIYASDSEEEVTLQSMHGGITTAESIVPLIVV